MSIIPEFDADGLLPPGDYAVTFAELYDSILVRGPASVVMDSESTWDASWRRYLVEHLEMLVKQLWAVGVDEIYVDGSFAEDKSHPNDIDGYFVPDPLELMSGRLQRALNILDPQKVWTWDPKSRKPCPGYPKKQLPMWHVYRVELYPHFPGLNSGIPDANGHPLEFPAAFRRSRRDGKARGIVKIIKERVSGHDS